MLSILIINAQEKDAIEQYKYGFIDIKTGKEITPLKYDKVYSFEKGGGVVKLDGKIGFINRNGKEITCLIYNNGAYFSEGFAELTYCRKLGFINKLGKNITPFRYDETWSFKNGCQSYLAKKN